MPNSRNSNNNSGRSRGRSNASRPTGKPSRNSRDASAKGSGKFDRKDSPKSFRKKSDDGFEAKRPSAFSKPGKKYFNSKSNSSEGGERKGFGKSSDRADDRPSKRSFSGERSSRPFKKSEGKSFDKPFRGKRGDDSGSFDKRESSSRGSSRPFKKSEGKSFDKPFRSKRGDDSSYDKKESSSRGSSRPFKKSEGKSFDKPFRAKREDDSSYDKKESSSRGSSRPFKRSEDKSFDKPFRSKRGDDAESFDKKDFKASGSSRSFKKSDRDFDKPEVRSFRKRISEDTEGDSRGFASKRKTVGGRKSFDAPATEAPAQTEKIRLNRYIANSGVCSRREADELIGMGLISVNGKTIIELGYKVNPGDEVRYESKVLKAEKPVYVLLNKPKGYLTTTVDPQERNTVMHLLGNHIKERIYPVGRLDRNTTGLLLLTNDGDLADKLMHPSYNAKKIYKVELDRPLTKADFQKILEGIHLEEGKAMVDDLAIISDDSKTVGVELHIGWNRVVRRIFESLEYQVVKLDRSVYAGLDKKDLGRGEWRFLKKEEIIRLKNYK